VATSAPGLTDAPVSTGTAVRPVMLLTLNTPLDPAAVEFAIGTAVETGAELFVCDAVPLTVGQPASNAARSFGDRDALEACTRTVAEARARGARAQEMLFHNPRPLTAATRVCKEQGVGLLVFAADRRRLGRLRYWQAVRRLRRDAPCLVWLNESPR
jgi:universal stress protein family protein